MHKETCFQRNNFSESLVRTDFYGLVTRHCIKLIFYLLGTALLYLVDRLVKVCSCSTLHVYAFSCVNKLSTQLLIDVYRRFSGQLTNRHVAPSTCQHCLHGRTDMHKISSPHQCIVALRAGTFWPVM